MKYILTVIIGIIVGGQSFLMGQPANFVWETPSCNSSESMPCGGGDIGMNVWVENNDILFYVSRSGCFDENNTLLKQGRFRLRIYPNPFEEVGNFKQILCLNEGYVQINGTDTRIYLWADVFHPVIHVEIEGKKTQIEMAYESWRTHDRKISKKLEGQQTSYKWAVPKDVVTHRDSIYVEKNVLTFFHHNNDYTVFDVAVSQQGLEAEKENLYNPLKNLTFGGCLSGDLIYKESVKGKYQDQDYTSWIYQSAKAKNKHHIQITLHTSQGTLKEWEKGLSDTKAKVDIKKDKQASRQWWKMFWQRSYIEGEGVAGEAICNYTLFRYMLGCNAKGEWPTKFNGGLFTFDPVNVSEDTPFSPDFRKWGGGTHTAQNQRLVYWPMLKSGDYDLMKPQFDYYNRLLATAETRSRVYWGHEGACYTEQMENFGLPNPAEYGFKRPESFDKGLEYNAWLEYEWDTVLEFCQMILETERYGGMDITPYLPMIESCLEFFDQHYRLLAKQRGRKELDEKGKLVLYPGSACETYKMTYNASSTIAALRKVLETYGRKPDMLERIPEIPLRIVDEHMMIAPAQVWERVNNVETPQLYPVFPWRIYGVGRNDLDIARNTYYHDPDALKFRSHIGWKQDNIWAACLGLTEEAAELMLKKLANGPHRFPAFWGPGYDWTPDHNWGGSGMIGMQEMLLQEVDEKIYLFPAWPKDWNVRFKLHASKNTTVEVVLNHGQIQDLKVFPESRKKDIINCLEIK